MNLGEWETLKMWIINDSNNNKYEIRDVYVNEDSSFNIKYDWKQRDTPFTLKAGENEQLKLKFKVNETPYGLVVGYTHVCLNCNNSPSLAQVLQKEIILEGEGMIEGEAFNPYDTGSEE